MNITAFINTVFRESGILRKFMLVMKITTFLLLVVLMQVSATGLAQKINLNEKNMSLKKVIEKVRLQSGYNFLYIEDILAQAKPVNINIKNADFETALKQIFINQPFDYEITTEKTVVIKEKAPSFLNRILETITADDVRGRILDERGLPLPNAVIRIKGTNLSYASNNNGEFSIKNIAPESILQISYVGYRTKEIPVTRIKDLIIITLELLDNKLEEVNILSTGYQTLPKERATGSFEQIDNVLFNRATGTDVITRLNGITTSAYFGGFKPYILPLDHKLNPIAQFSIRGLSTFLNDSRKPLLVVDNFPYEGDVNNLNPNDVESITILKDAAAASIWGTRAGNGVIVITTKKGVFDKPLTVSVNSNVTIGQKPNLFYLPQMKSADLVDYETFLYTQGNFEDALSDKYRYISPVVDLLDRQSKDPTNPVYQQKLNELRNNDLRTDELKYIYRNTVNQQHALNISGGGKQFNYYLSGGYDKNLESKVTDSYDRVNLRMNTIFKPIKNLEIEAGILYTQSSYDESGSGQNYLTSWLPYPYVKLADNQGNPLSVYPYNSVNKNYLDTAGSGRLLDWTFKPLAEINQTPQILKAQDVLMNIGITYKINSIFSASVKYQYEKNNADNDVRTLLGSWFARDLINRYSQYSYSDINSPVSRPVPTGAIVDNVHSDLVSSSARGQVNANKIWNKVHSLTAIAGVEIKQVRNTSFDSGLLYGFNNELLTVTPVDNSVAVPYYNDADYWGLEIPPTNGTPTFTSTVNRYTSFYANAGYSYNTRYILSASMRKDASNIFGAKPNRRGQPLWSVGLGWILSEEPSFKSNFFNYLKLRATYGYQGNISNNYSAYPTITYQPTANTINNLPYATNTNPPNSGLGWEKIGTINFGLDYSILNNRLSGTIEYYDKRATNLITNTPIPSSTGFSLLPVNSANLHGKGFEFTIQSLNIKTTDFQWTTNLLFSYNRNVVTKYLVADTRAAKYVMLASGALQSGAFKEGDDAYSLYTYKWAGLNPETGAPRGYVNGEISEDYAAIIAGNVKDLDNKGAVSPHYFGAFRNTFGWKGFSISANIQYKFDYVVAKTGIDYSELFAGGVGNADYSKRWQKPGDELNTNVPALLYPTNQNANTFYTRSGANVISGDHIRLQDITLSHSFPKGIYYLRSLKVYANVNNVGILWRANKVGIDPDAGNFSPAPRTVALGFSASF